MEFEWDEKKSRENKRNHGLSFEQVREIVAAKPNPGPPLFAPMRRKYGPQ